MLYYYRAKIIKVYDGDTVTARVNVGFKIEHEIKIRLYGINTPEIRGEEREQGLISRDRLRELILGKDVILKTYKDKKGKYGRYLAEIYLEDNSVFESEEQISVNQLLIQEGLAERYE